MLYSYKFGELERTYKGTPAEIISLLDYERCCDKMDDFQERQRAEKEKLKESPQSNFVKEVLSKMLFPLVTIVGIEVGQQLVDDEGFKWTIDDIVLEDEYPIKLSCSSLMADRMIKFEDLVASYKPYKESATKEDDQEKSEKDQSESDDVPWFGICTECPYAAECGNENCDLSCEDFKQRYIEENKANS